MVMVVTLVSDYPMLTSYLNLIILYLYEYKEIT